MESGDANLPTATGDTPGSPTEAVRSDQLYDPCMNFSCTEEGTDLERPVEYTSGVCAFREKL